MSGEDEWVTVAEAARRLGVDQRQARRVIGRLSAADRTPAEVRPARVRMGALGVRSVAEIPEGNARSEVPELSGELSETVTLLHWQLIAKDRQIEGLLQALRDAKEITLYSQKLHYNDQHELRELRARLAIAEAPKPEPRGLLERLMDRLKRKQ